MYVLKKTTAADLGRVQATIKKELASEKIIQEIYEYIFKQKENTSFIMFTRL